MILIKPPYNKYNKIPILDKKLVSYSEILEIF